MERRFLGIALAGMLMLAAGCGQTDSAGEISELGKTPEAAVTAFLEAVRTGDDELACAMLTALARRKTEESDMVVSPPGSDTAKFQVRGTELLGSRARVASCWTDLDTDGQPHTDEIVWILRQQPEGWRISGMEARVTLDQNPIELNFEDPAEMLRKQQQAEEELARRQQADRARLKESAEGPQRRQR